LGSCFGCLVLIVVLTVAGNAGYQALRRRRCPVPEAQDWVFYYQLPMYRTGTGYCELKAFRPFRSRRKAKRTVLPKVITPENLPAYTVGFDVSPDGRTLAAQSMNELWLVDLPTGEFVWYFWPYNRQTMHGRPVFSHDGRKIGVFADAPEPPGKEPDRWKKSEMSLYVFDVKDGSDKELASGFLLTGASPVWSGDDSFIYGVDSQRRVVRVDTVTGETEVFEKTIDAVGVLAVTEDSIVYYDCEGRSGPPLDVKKWRLDGSGVKLLRSFQGALMGVPSPDGRYLLIDEHIGKGASFIGFLDIKREVWYYPYELGWAWTEMEVIYHTPEAWLTAGPVSWPE